METTNEPEPDYAVTLIGEPVPGFNKRTKGKENERGQIPSFGTILLKDLAQAARQALI